MHPPQLGSPSLTGRLSPSAPFASPGSAAPLCHNSDCPTPSGDWRALAPFFFLRTDHSVGADGSFDSEFFFIPPPPILLLSQGMIYPPSTAMRFQRISPSDRLPPRALHHSCRHLNRGRTAPVHPLRITYIYVTERDVRNWRQIVQQQRRGLPLEKHHYLAQLHTAPRSITLYLSTPRPTKMRFAWSVRLS